ncbi:MAG: hypothetical protein IIA17_10275 [candidate division Zixibacteria bacterium]|nr:hypothetical protein [candidate division Zixibacteria bacterium]
MNNHKKSKFQLLGLLLLTFAISAVLMSCTVIVKSKRPHDHEVVVVKENKGRPAHLGIPPGHLPAPGQCRIWFPGRPPGRQPRPGNCVEVERHVRPGCWLVRRSLNDPKHIKVMVYSHDRPSSVLSVRYYLAESGKFAWEEHPKRRKR